MRRRFPAAAAAILGVLALAPAVPAAHDPDRKGWFLNLEAGSVTPGNTNTPVIASVPADGGIYFATGDVATDVEWMDFDADFTWRAGLGYSWGKKGALQVNYWEYSDKASSDGFAPSYYASGGSNYNFFTIGPTNAVGYNYYTWYYDIAWGFEQEIEARSIDLEYTRSHATGDKFVLTWGVGLRFAEFEDRVDGTYLLDPDNVSFLASYRFPAERTIEGDGWGFTGSVGADYDFNPVFGIGTKLRLGFINADVESSHAITDRDNFTLNFNGASVTWRERQKVEDELANTVDFDFDLKFHVVDQFEIDVGYGYTTWSDLPTPQLSRAMFLTSQQAGAEIPGETRERISFAGPRVRLKITF